MDDYNLYELGYIIEKILIMTKNNIWIYFTQQMCFWFYLI